MYLLAVGGVAALAQDLRIAEGKVQRPGDKGPVAVSGAWVVLHRVGTDRSAPLDSVRAGANGSFGFRYRASGAPDAIYFVSTMYRGIAYFSSPLRDRTVRGGDADLLVYDTTTATTTLHVTGMHVVISAPRNGRREIAQIFEIENDGTRTVVPRDSTRPHWAAIMPPDAESLAVAPGDLSEGAVAFRGGRAEVFAPISPGVRQLVVTYRLPASAFPLSLPLERPVAVLEVLLEEPRSVVNGAGLSESAAVEIDGRQFRRFLARNVGPPGVMTIKAQPPSSGNSTALLIVVVTLAVAASVAFAVWYSRRPARPSSTGVRASQSDMLLAELASLDARYAKNAGASAAEREQYERQRADLKERVARALAGKSSPA
jgi:hypothetical protein